MHGVKSIALLMIKHAVVVSFALPVFGVPLKIRALMPNKSIVWSIIVAATTKRTRNKP